MEKEPLEHAIRCWKAEEENASRIAGRKTLIVGLPAGLLAFVGFSADNISKLLAIVFAWDTRQPKILWPALIGVLLLLLGLGCLLVSVALAVGVRRRDAEQRGVASELLHPLRRQDIVSLGSASDEDARAQAFALTLGAARTLLRLNQAVELRLYDAVAWLLAGIVFSLLAVLAYAWVLP